jgi:hypothetical protein
MLGELVIWRGGIRRTQDGLVEFVRYQFQPRGDYECQERQPNTGEVNQKEIRFSTRIRRLPRGDYEAAGRALPGVHAGGPTDVSVRFTISIKSDIRNHLSSLQESSGVLE